MYDHLSFTINNPEGKMVTCNILSVLPTEEDYFYVVFTDGETDSEQVPVFKYGKMLENHGEFELKAGVSEDELEKIKRHFSKEIQKLVDAYQNRG